MYCPNCGYKQYCGCKSCKDKVPKDMKSEIWDYDKDLVSCANCGLSASMDWWENLDLEVWELTKE